MQIFFQPLLYSKIHLDTAHRLKFFYNAFLNPQISTSCKDLYREDRLSHLSEMHITVCEQCCKKIDLDLHQFCEKLLLQAGNLQLCNILYKSCSEECYDELSEFSLARRIEKLLYRWGRRFASACQYVDEADVALRITNQTSRELCHKIVPGDQKYDSLEIIGAFDEWSSAEDALWLLNQNAVIGCETGSPWKSDPICFTGYGRICSLTLNQSFNELIGPAIWKDDDLLFAIDAGATLPLTQDELLIAIAPRLRHLSILGPINELDEWKQEGTDLVDYVDRCISLRTIELPSSVFRDGKFQLNDLPSSLCSLMISVDCLLDLRLSELHKLVSDRKRYPKVARLTLLFPRSRLRFIYLLLFLQDWLNSSVLEEEEREWMNELSELFNNADNYCAEELIAKFINYLHNAISELQEICDVKGIKLRVVGLPAVRPWIDCSVAPRVSRTFFEDSVQILVVHSTDEQEDHRLLSLSSTTHSCSGSCSTERVQECLVRAEMRLDSGWGHQDQDQGKMRGHFEESLVALDRVYLCKFLAILNRYSAN